MTFTIKSLAVASNASADRMRILDCAIARKFATEALDKLDATAEWRNYFELLSFASDSDMAVAA